MGFTSVWISLDAQPRPSKLPSKPGAPVAKREIYHNDETKPTGILVYPETGIPGSL